MLESTYTHIHRQTHIITKTKMAIRDLLLHNRTFQYKPLLGALYHRQSVIDTSVATPSCCWSFWCILGRAWSEMLKYCHIHNLNDAGFSLAFRTSQRIFSLVPYLGGRMSQWDVKEDWFNLESCSGLMALTVESVLALIPSSLKTKVPWSGLNDVTGGSASFTVAHIGASWERVGQIQLEISSKQSLGSHNLMPGM